MTTAPQSTTNYALVRQPAVRGFTFETKDDGMIGDQVATSTAATTTATTTLQQLTQSMQSFMQGTRRLTNVFTKSQPAVQPIVPQPTLREFASCDEFIAFLETIKTQPTAQHKSKLGNIIKLNFEIGNREMQKINEHTRSFAIDDLPFIGMTFNQHFNLEGLEALIAGPWASSILRADFRNCTQFKPSTSIRIVNTFRYAYFLQKLAQLPKLDRYILPENICHELDDISISYIPETFTYLDFHNSSISDFGMQMIAERFPNARGLDLRGSSCITNDSIAILNKLHSLEEVKIRGTRIETDAYNLSRMSPKLQKALNLA